MQIAETRYDNRTTGCCAPLDRAYWDGKLFHWQDQLFLKDHVRELLHIPLDFGAVMKRDAEAIDQASAWPEHPFTLSDERSAWGADLYTAVDREVPGGQMARLSGTFMTRAYQGPFSDISRWIADMKAHVAETGHTLDRLYFYYATCPKCAKKLGRNEVVLFARVL